MRSPTEFYHVIQIILLMCPCDQRLVTLAFLWEKLSQPQFYKDLDRRNSFFGGGLGSSSIIWDWHQAQTWNFTPLWQKTKGQKVLGANSYVCRSYWGKTGRGPFCPSCWIGLIRISIIIAKHFLYLVYVRPCLDVDLFMMYLCDLFFFLTLIIINQIVSLK